MSHEPDGRPERSATAPRRVGLVSLGCPKNLVDSEVMLGLVEAAGHEITRDASAADVLVVNTCAFIDTAREESIDAILEMAQLKVHGRCQRLIVTGCLAERYRDALQTEIPEIDVVLGTGQVPAIVDALEAGAVADTAAPVGVWHREADGSASRRAPSRHREALARGALPTYLYDATTPRTLSTPQHFAYLKVAEGCDYNCAFCIIPTLRGRYRSRTADSVLQEARALAGRGVRELILVSQDTTFYGIDRGERGALASLLRQLDRIEGLSWIRLLYLYPTTLTPDVLDAMAECGKVCRYVDLPLQHAAPEVLRRMRRPGGRASYERLAQTIRERVPGVTLRTTFIVGFPGETDADVDELCAFVDSVAFDHVGVFTYSHEEGTAAHRMVDDVPAAVKQRRRHRVMARQRRLVERRLRALVGTRARVLVDGPSPEHELVLQGRLEGHAPEIDPVVYLTEADPARCPAGGFVDGTIVAARGYDLVIRPLPEGP